MIGFNSHRHNAPPIPHEYDFSDDGFIQPNVIELAAVTNAAFSAQWKELSISP